MTDGPTATLMDAARSYLSGLDDAARMDNQAEVERFVRWCGADRTWTELRVHEVATYADTITGTVTDATARANAVKKFLAAAKKAGHTSSNLGVHLRIKRRAGSRAAEPVIAFEDMEISEDEKRTMTEELESLKAQRPQIIADIQRAREDKDFRENAPLDAARERQGYIEGRIQKIEITLDLATVIVDGPAPDGSIVEVGCTVILRNLSSDAESTFTLVRPSEVNATQGRISFDSPVGRALLRKRAGAEVEVEAPSGTLRFRIESIEG